MKNSYYFISIVVFIATIRGYTQNITYGKGNTTHVTIAASSNTTTATNTLTQVGFLPSATAASRFLSQATLGHNLSNIQEVANIGIEKWLDNQLAMPNSFGVKNYLGQMHQAMVDSLNAKNPAGNYTLNNVFIGYTHFDITWFQGAMTAPDVLRWRVAWALSEIFVTSRVSALQDYPYGLASYYDVLLNNAFSNYRTLIQNITYHPAMGVYLTYMNNHATDTTSTRKVYPDENYAREIMQLFSIGLYELNLDGTEKRDANGKLIPTYNNNDIAGLAKIFTGLSWGDSRYLGDNYKNRLSHTLPMKFFGIDSSDAKMNPWKTTPRIVNGHEPGIKTFLGQTVAARPVLQGEQDIQDGLDIIFNHPNVGPFIARRLIQRLVMSNPSPAYIQRIATVFNNNGSGVRGDLKAVIKAILLDQEARDCCVDKSNNLAGQLREPILRYMQLMRGLPLTTTGGVYRNVMNDFYNRIGQRALNSPSVFNYFQPDYQPIGAIKDANGYAPEFQILNTQSIANYINALNLWLIIDYPTEYWELFNGETYKPDQAPKFNLTGDYYLTKDNRLPELLDKYNLIFAGGKLSTKTLQSIEATLKQMPLRIDTYGINTNDASRRLRIALLLILSSPDYLINR